MKVNDIIQPEKKKNDQQPKFLKVDRQVTVASKKHWMKSEVWASSSLRVYSKCQHQLKHVHVTSIFSALNRRQMERRWDTTRVHLVPKLLFFNLGFYRVSSFFTVIIVSVLGLVSFDIFHWRPLRFYGLSCPSVPYQIHPQPLHQCHGGERFLRESQV